MGLILLKILTILRRSELLQWILKKILIELGNCWMISGSGTR